MAGLDLKADAVRARVPLYRVAAEARINPNHLSRLLNERVQMDIVTEARIRDAIARLSGPQAAVRD